MEKELRIKEDVVVLAEEMNGLKGKNTMALKLDKDCSWTGYLLITTCSSQAHLNGMVSQIRKKTNDLGYSITNNRKNPGNQNWVLLDCRDFVINLMTDESRDYYNLEEKWNKSEIIYSSSKLS